MSLKAAQELEKKDFLARARAAIRQSRKAEAEARRQAEQGERERAEFEAGAANHAGRKALLEAVAAYHAAQDEFAALGAQIDSVRVEHEQLATQANLPADRLGQQLGKLSDLRNALELRARQLKSRLSELFENLRKAYQLAQWEFIFLHRREREARVTKARDKLLQAGFSLSADERDRVAQRYQNVLDLDVTCAYRGGYTYDWPYLASPCPAPELIEAASQLERRFANFDVEIRIKSGS